MTEAEWLAATDPEAMYAFVETRASRRKLRLFACACCRRITYLLTEPAFADAIEVAERYADGNATEAECRLAHDEVDRYNRTSTPEHTTTNLADMAVAWPLDVRLGDEFARHAAGCARHAAELAARHHAWSATEGQVVYPTTWPPPKEVMEAHIRSLYARNEAIDAAVNPVVAQEEAAQVQLIREIFGNPFRPVAVDPAWLTPTVVALARGTYDDHAFDRLPILADALQDAGCDADDLLTHLRDPHATHVRGCWALDVVLGKS